MSDAITGLEFGSRRPVIDDVMCNGSESRLQQCTNAQPGPISSECTNSTDRAAGVRCYQCQYTPTLGFHNPHHTCFHPHTVCYPGSVRLAGGQNRSAGRVEVCSNNTWGTICDEGWDARDARPACSSAEFYWGETHDFIKAQQIKLSCA